MVTHPPGRLRVVHSALLAERIARHGFGPEAADSVVAAVARTTAIQAQDHPAARLGVRVRSAGLTDADVLSAVGAGSVVRTWLMRGTIHLVDLADVRWLVALFGPALERKFAQRWRGLGLDGAFADKCLDALPAILADGPRTRAEIDAALAAGGLTYASPDPQAGLHLMLIASARGLVCRAGDRGRTATFALLDEWVAGSPQGPRGDAALAELARRFYRAYSPATSADLSTWSGLAGARATSLIRDELTPVDVGGKPGFRLGAIEPARGVRLLPAYDNYLIGYRERNFVPEAARADVYVGGVIRPTVIDDGRVVARWSLSHEALVVTPFMDLTRRVKDGIARDAADVSRLLGRDLSLRW